MFQMTYSRKRTVCRTCWRALNLPTQTRQTNDSLVVVDVASRGMSPLTERNPNLDLGHIITVLGLAPITSLRIVFLGPLTSNGLNSYTVPALRTKG